MSRRIIISIHEDLPVRPRALSSDALSKVFGGCAANGSACSQDADCCSAKCGQSFAGSQQCQSEWGTKKYNY